MLNHMVFFKIKDSAPKDKVEAVFNKLAEIYHEIEPNGEFASGYNNSVEGLSRDYNYGMHMRFANIANRDAYVNTPKHGEWVENHLKTIWDDSKNEPPACVLDFE